MTGRGVVSFTATPTTSAGGWIALFSEPESNSRRPGNLSYTYKTNNTQSIKQTNNKQTNKQINKQQSSKQQSKEQTINQIKMESMSNLTFIKKDIFKIQSEDG